MRQDRRQLINQSNQSKVFCLFILSLQPLPVQCNAARDVLFHSRTRVHTAPPQHTHSLLYSLFFFPLQLCKSKANRRSQSFICTTLFIKRSSSLHLPYQDLHSKRRVFGGVYPVKRGGGGVISCLGALSLALVPWYL